MAGRPAAFFHPPSIDEDSDRRACGGRAVGYAPLRHIHTGIAREQLAVLRSGQDGGV